MTGTDPMRTAASYVPRQALTYENFLFLAGITESLGHYISELSFSAYVQVLILSPPNWINPNRRMCDRIVGTIPSNWCLKMREVTVSWGSAIKVAWSIGWRLVLYLIPAYALAHAMMLAAMIAGDSLQGPVIWGVVLYFVLQALWIAAVAVAFLFAVKQVIGKSYGASSFPPVAEDFRITLVSDA